MQRYLGADVLITVAAAVALAGPAGHRFATKTQQCIASRSRSLAIGAELVGLTALLFLVFLSLAGGAYNPFIYFRF
jgi:hypothetical protein